MLARETGLCLKLLQSLARRPDELTPISAIAEELQLSRPYAAKLCHRLRNAGYLDARQGMRGGFRLTTTARNSTLHELAIDLSDPFVSSHCVLLRAACDDETPCPLHETWSALHASTLEAFRACPIANADVWAWVGPRPPAHDR